MTNTTGQSKGPPTPAWRWAVLAAISVDTARTMPLVSYEVDIDRAAPLLYRLEGRKIDVAIVWGPAAGYFVKNQRVPLAMVPVPSGKGDLPFEFDIAMGVKIGNDALKAQLEKVLGTKQAEIAKILKDYGVPVIDRSPASLWMRRSYAFLSRYGPVEP